MEQIIHHLDTHDWDDELVALAIKYVAHRSSVDLKTLLANVKERRGKISLVSQQDENSVLFYLLDHNLWTSALVLIKMIPESLLLMHADEIPPLVYFGRRLSHLVSSRTLGPKDLVMCDRILHLMLETKVCNVNVMDSSMMNVLHYLAKHPKLNHLSYKLLSAGCDFLAFNGCYETPVSIAYRNDNVHLINKMTHEYGLTGDTIVDERMTLIELVHTRIVV